MNAEKSILEKSILEMAHGGFIERVDYEMPKVLENILNPNTKATAKRKLTITMEFAPNDDRNDFITTFSTKMALAPTNPIRTVLNVYVSNDTGEIMVREEASQVPGQLDLIGMEQEQPALLKLVK